MVRKIPSLALLLLPNSPCNMWRSLSIQSAGAHPAKAHTEKCSLATRRACDRCVRIGASVTHLLEDCQGVIG